MTSIQNKNRVITEYLNMKVILGEKHMRDNPKFPNIPHMSNQKQPTNQTSPKTKRERT